MKATWAMLIFAYDPTAFADWPVFLAMHYVFLPFVIRMFVATKWLQRPDGFDGLCCAEHRSLTVLNTSLAEEVERGYTVKHICTTCSAAQATFASMWSCKRWRHQEQKVLVVRRLNLDQYEYSSKVANYHTQGQCLEEFERLQKRSQWKRSQPKKHNQQ